MTTVPSKAGEIFTILRSEVLRGQYREGERLPSERDLAARFETNRGAIREVIKKLEQLGIVSVTPGGVRVQPVEEASLEVLGHLLELGEIPRPDLIIQMLDVLGAMMSVSVRTAVESAGDQDIADLTELMDRLIDTLNTPDAHHECWRELGERMMEVHQNLVLRLVGNGLRTQFLGAALEPGQDPDFEPEIDLEEVAQQLTAVRDAITSKDAWAASSAMTNHFKTLKERIQIATSTTLQPARSATHG